MIAKRVSVYPRVSLWFVLALALLLPSEGLGGTIGFSITTQIDTAAGVESTITLKNTGDEAAHGIRPSIQIGDEKINGDKIARLHPGRSHSWKLKIRNENLDDGTYAALVRVKYEDANAYPFEIVTSSRFNVNFTPRPAVGGHLGTIRLQTGHTSNQGQLVLRIPNHRTGKRYQVDINLPGGVTGQSLSRTLEPSDQTKHTIPFTLRNSGLLAGTTVNYFAFVTSLDDVPPQTDVIEGQVRVIEAPPVLTDKDFFAAAILFLLFLITFEIIAGGTRRTEVVTEQGPWPELAMYALIFAPCAFLLYHYPWDALLAPTVTAGGDMGSLYYPTKLLAEEVLPRGELTGWTMGNYAGYPVFHFYSTLPFAAIAVIGKFVEWAPVAAMLNAVGIPLQMEQIFKLVTIIGPTTLPLAAAYLFRCIGYSRGAAILASVSVLPFLLQQGNSMWGGNIPSVLAGEYCHAIGLTLALVFLGVLHRAVHHNGSWILAGVLLAAVGLSHTFAFFAALWYSLFYLWPRDQVTRTAPPVLACFLLAFLLLCFWGLPVPSRLIYTTEFKLVWNIRSWTEVLPEPLWPAALMAIFGLLITLPKLLRPMTFLAGAGIVHFVLHRWLTYDGLINWLTGTFPSTPIPMWLVLAATSVAALPTIGPALAALAVTLSAWFFFTSASLALPFAWVAGLALAVALPRREFSSERQGFLWFMALGGVLLYYLVPKLKFPDIRFVPVVQTFTCLLAADFLYWASGIFRFRMIAVAALLCFGLGWGQSHLGYIPSWLKWNYTGYEGKATWNLFHDINEHIKGDINDPRVMFEHNDAHNRFGTSRAFENIPLFSGRPTLEGVFHQASQNSPFIFYLQSEAGEKASGPFPQYSYRRLDVERALPHMRMYNVADIVVVTDKAREAYKAHPAFEETFSQGTYSVFHIDGGNTGYVVPAESEPVLYNGPDWKMAFYRWYKHDHLIDIPLVPGEFLTGKEAREFALRTDSVTRLPRRPLNPNCEIKTHIEQYRISFDTNCPNQPHIVKISYFPRWHTVDGSRLFPVSPGFMLVYPKSTHVEIEYRRNFIDWLGLAMTGGGLVLLFACLFSSSVAAGVVNLAATLSLPILRLFERWAVPLTCVLVVVSIVGGYYARLSEGADDRHYKLAQDAYRNHQHEEAIPLLQAYIATERDTFKQATSLFQLGVAYSHVKQHAAAAQAHERLRFEFPNVNYGAGTLFHLARNYLALGSPTKAAEYARLLRQEFPDSGWRQRLERENPKLYALSEKPTTPAAE